MHIRTYRKLCEALQHVRFQHPFKVGRNRIRDHWHALRLAVKLRMIVRVEDYGASARIEGKPHGAWNGCEAHLYGGIESATRRCIVRAAAELARAGAQKG